MAGFTFFQYLKLRVQIAFVRLFLNVTTSFTNRRATVHPSVAFRKLGIPSRDAGRKIKVHVYEPKALEAKNGPTPVVINMHGSGYVLPSLGWDREYCSFIAERAAIPVLDADYRKAPEHPFPSAFNDFEDILAFVRAQSHLYDPARIILSGFSAGAVITLTGSNLDVRSLAARYPAPLAAPPPVRGIISFYPSVDRSKFVPAPDALDLKAGHAGAVLPVPLLRLLGRAYLPPGAPPPTDPRISPRFAPRGAFPQFMFLTCGTADAFYSPSEEFMRGMEGTRVGREGAWEGDGPKDGEERVVRFVGLKGEGHGWDKAAKKGSIAEKNMKEAYEGALEMVKLAIA